MTPVRATRNQYRGINAHLHSIWQGLGGWEEFHTSHIVFLATALKAQLLPMGYTAGIEQSLQIRRAAEMAGKPRSDVTIYDLDRERAQQWPAPAGSAAPLVAPIPDVVDDVEELAEYRALAIYQFEANDQTRGEPVAWIELLSPSNKPGGQDAFYYRSKRLKLLHSGIVFLELDYLHESPPTFDRLGDKGTYRIIVIDPRPAFAEGQVYTYPFAVDDPLPEVHIPLNAGDSLAFDFGRPYARTIEESLFTLELVDYSQLPVNFDHYGRDDQVRILARMLAVMRAVRDGVNLETGTLLAVENVSFETALQEIENWS